MNEKTEPELIPINLSADRTDKEKLLWKTILFNQGNREYPFIAEDFIVEKDKLAMVPKIIYDSAKHCLILQHKYV